MASAFQLDAVETQLGDLERQLTSCSDVSKQRLTDDNVTSFVEFRSVRSLRELRAAPENSSLSRQDRNNLMVYLDSIDTLRKIHSLFRHNVYAFLQQLDPDLSHQSKSVSTPAEPANANPGSSSSYSSGGSSGSSMVRELLDTNSIKLPRLTRELKEFERVYPDRSQAVTRKELGRGVIHWARLLHDDTVFDSNLLPQTLVADDTGEVTYLLLLIPCVVQIGRTCSELARELVTIYINQIISATDRVSKLTSLQQAVTDSIRQLDLEMKVSQSQLEKNADDLQRLLRREERCSEIEAQIFDNHMDRVNLHKDIQEVENETIQLAKGLDSVSIGLSARESAKIFNKYQANQVRLSILHTRSKAKEYQSVLLNDDFDLELEVKPFIVRYVNDLQEKCDRIERQLEEQQKTRSTLEYSLLPELEIMERAVKVSLTRGRVKRERSTHADILTLPTIDTASATPSSALRRETAGRRSAEPQPLLNSLVTPRSTNVQLHLYHKDQAALETLTAESLHLSPALRRKNPAYTMTHMN